MSDAVLQIDGTDASPRIVLTCEHASNRIPAPYAWPDADRWLVHTHWAWDPGAAHVARMLAKRFGAPAVLSRFSRLLVDPNRDLESETLFRHVADDRRVELNHALSDEEKAHRIEMLYKPYHDAVDAMVAAHDAVVVSVHSFTPTYEGQPRSVEVGVLHDSQPELGQAVRRALEPYYDARDNEPWDGRKGLMFGPQSHADNHGRQAVEFEIRQDLATDPRWRGEFVDRVVGVLNRLV